MSWLTDFVKPCIKSFVRRETPDNLWQKCPACEQMLFHRELTENLHVCKHCDEHLRFPLKERLSSLFDDGKYERLTLGSVVADPLHFKDTKKYTDRLKDARSKTHEDEAIVVAQGEIGRNKVVVACFNFDFIGGSMGIAVGEALVKGAAIAVADQTPFIVIPASGGARMQEGILSLMQMPRSIIAISRLKEAGVPYILILTNPTTGGVAASFAALGDITLAEPRAIIGFTGARVIQETLRVPLPRGFQTAEFQRDHGMVDQVVHRRNLRGTLVFVCTFFANARRLRTHERQQKVLTAAG